LDTPRREPNPRPLLMLLMTVAFLGDSCALQKVVGVTGEKPSEQEVAKLLAERGGLPEDPEAARRVTTLSYALVEAQERVGERFRPYETGFALLLVAAYTFVLVFGVRAYGWAPGSARGLARVSIFVLPARVAVAAVDFASTRALGPATRDLTIALTASQKTPLPADQAAQVQEAIGNLAQWVPVALQIAMALFVCILFQQASRYFQKAEVLALFDRKAPPEPDGL